MLYPAVPPALALLAGAAIGCAWPCARNPLAACLLVACYGLSLVALMARRRRASLASALTGFAFAALVLASSAAHSALHPTLEERVTPDGGPMLLEATVRQDASAGEGSVNLSLEVTGTKQDGTLRPVTGGIVLGVNGAVAREHYTEWTAGRRLRLSAALREPGSYADPGVQRRDVSLARRGTRFVGSVKSGALVEVIERGGWWAEQAAEARRFARGAIEASVGRYSRASSAIVVAILIGDRVGLEDEVQRQLQEAGTYHVIAISGGNIAILAGLLLGLLRAAGVRSRWSLAVVIVLLAGYRSLVGGGASVDRATLMAATYLVAEIRDHRSAPLNALAVAGGLLVCLAPLSVVDPGFMLTFGATLGILVGVRWLGGRLPRSRWLAAPAALLLASVSAELALLPVSAFAFSRVTFAGLALNFVAIPLMSVAQVAGMAVLALAPVSAALASLAGYLAHLGAAGLVRSAQLVELVPWLAWRVPPPALPAIACYYAGGGTVVWLMVSPAAVAPRTKRALLLTASALLFASASWILASPAGRIRGAVADGRLRVAVLDVGQADSMLIRFPDASAMLVDTGGSRVGSFDIGGRVIMPTLWALDVYHLDVLALSHGDPDHAGGAAALLRDFKIGEVWEGIPVPRDAGLAALRSLAARRGTRWRTVLEGTVLHVGGVALRVWHPPPPDWERQKVRNDDSLVIELRWRDVSILLPGDIGQAVERDLARRLRPSPLRILKVPHHGSATSSCAEFVETVRPSAAILTAAGERSSPALEAVLARYRAISCPVFRTGVDGAVFIETDGTTAEIRTFRGRSARLLPPGPR